MRQTGRPKNFDKILALANEMLSYMRESDDKTWHDKYEQLWYQKLDEVQSLVFADKQLQEYLSPEDVREHLLNIVVYLGKGIKDITSEDCERYLDKLLQARETYDFFFPAMELFGFPDGYKLGACDLHSFDKLSSQAQNRISSEWDYTFEREKLIYHAQTRQEYEHQKREETYFCLRLEALGDFKAIEVATGRANQSLNILKNFYFLEHQPKLKRCHYVRHMGEESAGGGGVQEERFKWGWYKYHAFPDIEEYIQTINNFVRNGVDDEIARRCLSVIDMYGLIEHETPLELKFLLSVMACETLLLGKDDRDFLGWKLREKVAILLGDTPGWYKVFLQKEAPTQQECEGSRIAARADLAAKVGQMYEKRSALVHRYEGNNKVTQDDFDFASSVMKNSLQRLLRLYNAQGIRRVPKTSPVDPNSLDGYIESMKYSVPLGW